MSISLQTLDDVSQTTPELLITHLLTILRFLSLLCPAAFADRITGTVDHGVFALLSPTNVIR